MSVIEKMFTTGLARAAVSRTALRMPMSEYARYRSAMWHSPYVPSMPTSSVAGRAVHDPFKVLEEQPIEPVSLAECGGPRIEGVPDMPVLNGLSRLLFSNPVTVAHFDRVAIAGYMHLLYPNLGILDCLMRDAGTLPCDIAVVGKNYSLPGGVGKRLQAAGVSYVEPHKQFGLGRAEASVVSEDIPEVWRRILARKDEINGVLGLCDGGYLLGGWPNRLGEIGAGVHWTHANLRNGSATSVPMPTVSAADSALKLYCESHIIAHTTACRILDRVAEVVPIEDPRYAIVGFGLIGRAIARELLRRGIEKPILVHDPNVPIHNSESIIGAGRDGAFAGAQVVIGCSGADVTAKSPASLEALTTERPALPTWLFSASSGDREFNTLLHMIVRKYGNHKDDPLQDCYYKTAGGKELWVAQGGTPITFTPGAAEAVPAEQIQYTAAMMLGALVQAATLKASDLPGERYMLDPRLQHRIAEACVAAGCPVSSKVKLTPEWFARNSSPGPGPQAVLVPGWYMPPKSHLVASDDDLLTSQMSPKR